MSARPLLLIDVDGPLNPFAAKWPWRTRGYTTHYFKPADWIARHAPTPPEQVPTLRVRLKPEHGRQLSALAGLGYELVWATTWMDDANDCIGPLLGLPQLPVIRWPELFRPDLAGLYWKTRDIVDWAAGRPFAWIDDHITAHDRKFVTAHHQGPALLHRVDPRYGLRNRDFAALAAWLRDNSGARQ